jgi:hypothetical protein
MIAYISGPMTGLPDLNYPAFKLCEAKLYFTGHTVYNPANFKWSGEGEFPIREAFAEYCDFICTKADTIVMLPGWKQSGGAIAEHALAQRIGLNVIYWRDQR